MQLNSTVLDKKEYERNYLIGLLMGKNNFSEDYLRSQTDLNLKKLYKKYFNIQKYTKTKLHAIGTSCVRFKIPSKIIQELNITYGDRFNIKRNIAKNEIYLDSHKEGYFKVGNDGTIFFPYVMHEKGWIRANETVVVESNTISRRITLKYI